MKTEELIENLEKRIEEIEKRNSRVELNKAWETSSVRRISVALLTYLVMVSFSYVISVSDPWINAVVPTLGFLLSTLSLSAIRDVWMRSHKK